MQTPDPASRLPASRLHSPQNHISPIYPNLRQPLATTPPPRWYTIPTYHPTDHRSDKVSDSQEFRLERDSMGEFNVPADAYYGANTMRAVLNFPISDLRFGRSFIHAIATIKLAAAQVNSELDLLPDDIADAIVTAAGQVADGDFDDQFVVDIFQTGSGTSTNMNANEVISNRAIENLGGAKGSRSPVHPNDHVNIGQSSNDVIPTAIHIAALKAIHDELIPALQELKADLDAKADEFMPIVKTGRTHLQDATPVRLGQEFLGHAGQVERGIARLKEAEKRAWRSRARRHRCRHRRQHPPRIRLPRLRPPVRRTGR